MGSKVLFSQLDADTSIENVREAVKRSFATLGGTIVEMGDNIQVIQGVNGVNLAFAANFDAMINVRQTKPGKFDLMCTVNWKPNGVFWAGVVVGFFLFGIGWIIPILYLFIDPTSAYQQALFRVQTYL